MKTKRVMQVAFLLVIAAIVCFSTYEISVNDKPSNILLEPIVRGVGYDVVGNTLIIQPIRYYNRTSGEYLDFDYEKETKFFMDDTSMTVEWLDKLVVVEFYTMKSNVMMMFSDAKQKDLNKYTTTVEKISSTKYKFEHRTNVEKNESPDKFGYVIRTFNVNCSVDGLKLVCDEQTIDFTDTYLQGLNVDIHDNFVEISASANSTLGLSYIDPDLTISSSGTYCGIQTYDTVIINNSATVTVCAYNGVGQNGTLTWNVGNFTMAAGAIIDGNVKGFRGGATQGAAGEGPGGTVAGDAPSAAGFGGLGSVGQSAVGGLQYGASDNATSMGSGGGANSGSAKAGGNGGAYVKINATGTVIINGTIRVNGGNAVGDASYASAPGSGGSVFIIANIVTGNGTINSTGGDGYNSGTYASGGAAGGRIHVQYVSSSSFNGVLGVSGGLRGGTVKQGGAAGTVLFEKQDMTYRYLIVDNAGKTTVVTNTTISNINLTNVLITSGANVFFNNTITVSNNITMSGSSTTYLTLLSTSSNVFQNFYLNATLYDKIAFNVTDNFVVYTAGLITQSHQNVNYVGGTLEVYGVVTHDDAVATSSIVGVVNFNVQNLTIRNGGTINVSGKGYLGGQTTGAAGQGIGGGLSNDGASGAGYAGYGGLGYASVAGGTVYGGPTNVTLMGSGGGAADSGTWVGGDGGGYIKINVTDTFLINGTILAEGLVGNGDGGSSGWAGGGGSGGGVWIITNKASGNGNVSVRGGNGGNGGATYSGGGGAGGRILIQYTINNSFSPTVLVNGGTSSTSTNKGSSGVSLINNDMFLDNSGNVGTSTPLQGINLTSLTIKSGSIVTMNGTFNVTNQLSIQNGVTNVTFTSTSNITLGNLTTNGTLFMLSTPLVVDSFTIQNLGSVTQGALSTLYVGNNMDVYGNYTHTDASGASLVSMTDINSKNFGVYNGGSVNVDSKGYTGGKVQSANGNGPGKSNTGDGAGGAGYGGIGGAGYGSVGGPAYANATNVTLPGSGAGASSYAAYAGGDGGGYVKINVTGTTNISGIIRAFGEAGAGVSGDSAGGGGSGGGVWIITGTIVGTGTINVTGGNGGNGGTYAGGGGAGGRILIQYLSNASSIKTNVNGGTGKNTGGVGSVTWTVLSDTTSPTVTLTSPNNGTTVQTAQQYFVATETDNLLLKNSTINVWNSTNNVINQTTVTITGVSNTTNVSVTLPYSGIFKWNYYVCDNAGNCAWAVANFTITTQLNLQSLNASMSDGITIQSDANPDAGMFRNEQDSFTMTNIANKIGLLFKSIASIININEVMVRLSNIFKLNFDSFGIDELTGRTYFADRHSNQNLDVSDYVLVLQNSIRGISNALNVEELVKSLTGMFRSNTDSFTITNLVSRNYFGVRTIQDQIDFTDSIDVLQNLIKRLIDAIDTNDFITSISRVFRKNVDSATFGDSLIRDYFGIRTSEQPLTISESNIALIAFIRSINHETIMNLLLDKIAYLIKNPNDSFEINTLVNRKFAGIRDISVVINETDSVGYLRMVIRDMGQDISINTITNRLAMIFRNPFQSFLIEMLTERTYSAGVQEYNVDVNQELLITMLTDRTLDGLRNIADSLNLDEIVKLLQSLFRSSDQNIDLTDTASLTKMLFRDMIDDLQFTDAIARFNLLFRNPEQLFTITEDGDHTIFGIRVLADQMGITDIVTAIANLFRTTNDGIEITDSTSLTKILLRNVLNNFQFTDAVDRIVMIFRNPSTFFTIDMSVDYSNFWNRMLSDPLGINHIISSIANIFRDVDDSVTITESNGRIYNALRSMVDGLGIGDSFSKLSWIFRIISDDLSVWESIDEPSGVDKYIALIAQQLGIGDTVDTIGNFFRNPTQNILINGISQRFIVIQRIIGDVINFVVSIFTEYILGVPSGTQPGGMHHNANYTLPTPGTHEKAPYPLYDYRQLIYICVAVLSMICFLIAVIVSKIKKEKK